MMFFEHFFRSVSGDSSVVSDVFADVPVVIFGGMIDSVEKWMGEIIGVAGRLTI